MLTTRWLSEQLEHKMKRRLSVTNLSSENNLPMFRLNAPVIIREQIKLFSKVQDNLFMQKPTEKPLKLYSVKGGRIEVGI